MKLELFTSQTCTNCRTLKRHLKEILDEIGEDYDMVVSEKSIEDGEVMAELLMLNVDSVPLIRIEGKLFGWDRTRDKTSLKKILTEHKK
ncbi:MAG: thioredoxin family protein [Candidatus Methanosuratincola sp.]|jgi:glutaredoxin|nr:thioredoxin family protein [Candidatus Methanosuratincola sp.]